MTIYIFSGWVNVEEEVHSYTSVNYSLFIYFFIIFEFSILTKTQQRYDSCAVIIIIFLCAIVLHLFCIYSI